MKGRGVAESVSAGWDKSDIRALFKAFKAMEEEAIEQSKRVSNNLADKMAGYIKGAARNSSRRVANSRVADAVKVSKSSKVGEFAYGFKSQRNFSGGANTLDMVYGLEFGSNRFAQFPSRSPNVGRGSGGYFIFPTLRQKQPEIVKEWESAFDRILKEYE
jgi:hypothetical protein